MPDEAIHLQLSVLVLAGGRSERMGRDKAWIEFDGAPLIEHILRRLSPIAAEFLVSVADPGPFCALVGRIPVPLHTVVDHYPGAGPLAGLHAGLTAASQPLVFAVATDMPFVNPALVRRMADLAAGFDAVIPRTPGDTDGPPLPEPLHALYRRACLPAVTRQIEAGGRRMVAFLSEIRVRYMDPAEIAPLDPDYLSFINVNTPDEWLAARARLAGQAGSPPPANR